MGKRIIPGYYPSKRARKLNSGDIEMRRLEQINNNLDSAEKIYKKKSDKYTKPM